MIQKLHSSEWLTMKSSKPIQRQNGDAIRMQHKRSWSIFSSEASKCEKLIRWDWTIYFIFFHSYTFYIYSYHSNTLSIVWQILKGDVFMLSSVIILLGKNTVHFSAKICILNANYFIFFISFITNQVPNILFRLNDTLEVDCHFVK